MLLAGVHDAQRRDAHRQRRPDDVENEIHRQFCPQRKKSVFVGKRQAQTETLQGRDHHRIRRNRKQQDQGNGQQFGKKVTPTIQKRVFQGLPEQSDVGSKNAIHRHPYDGKHWQKSHALLGPQQVFWRGLFSPGGDVTELTPRQPTQKAHKQRDIRPNERRQKDPAEHLFQRPDFDINTGQQPDDRRGHERHHQPRHHVTCLDLLHAFPPDLSNIVDEGRNFKRRLRRSRPRRPRLFP